MQNVGTPTVLTIGEANDRSMPRIHGGILFVW
jgi:hypothetical protein